jgi:hypothetical protein
MKISISILRVRSCRRFLATLEMTDSKEYFRLMNEDNDYAISDHSDGITIK